MANKDIIQELNELGSSLAHKTLQNTFSVPDGYFEDFAIKTLGLIKSNDSWLSGFPKETPYRVPVGYFDGLEEKIMEMIRNHADYQTSEEELESLSPLLNSLNKRPVYSVPQGYFENFNVAAADNKIGADVISITGRKWFSYAAAAVMTSVLVLAGFLIYNNNHKGAADQTLARFEKEVKKIDDVKRTETLIDFMDAGLNQEELATNRKNIKTDDVQKLLQDIPIDELKAFNEQSRDIEDVMMTN
jgi:hypothetical protein